ncbi:MAG: hypothetical protein AABW67_04825 [Nanoarchaeota archaeon]
MKKIILISLLFIALFSILATAQEEEHNFTEAKQLIDSKVSCNNLTNDQLEIIGDYYMEQMHPGEAHEYMDKMMGGEGSETLKQIHINIAKRIYCNENIGMMGGGMMAGGGMMGNYNYQNNSYGFQVFFYIILTLVIISSILVIILLINKSRNNIKQKRRITK